MRRYFFLAVIYFLSLTASAASEDMHLIAVNGVAENTVDPNMVTLLVDSWGKASTVKPAQEIQAAQYKKIQAVIEKYKIKKDDFKSENFSVQPEMVYEPKTQRNKITGYRASHQINITFRKIEEVGALVDDLIQASKNDTQSGVSIQNIFWETDKRSVYENAVINDAVRGARSRAEELAKAAGVKIKAVHRITHMSYAPSQAFSRMEKAMAASADADEGGGTQLSPGKIKIRVEVQMEFEI